MSRMRTLLFILAAVLSVESAQYPDSCLTQSSFDGFMRCWSEYIAGSNSLTDDDWKSYQPTKPQLDDWKLIVRKMLDSDGTCDKLQVPTSNGGFYSLSTKTFQDKSGVSKLCILHETKLKGNRFSKGWGMFVVPFEKKWIKYDLHYSAAHPNTDGPVHMQAANVFLRTQGRSLLIPGAQRDGYGRNDTVCGGGCPSDAAHDTRTMFQQAQLAIYNWQFPRGKPKTCTSSNCAFIQFHGMVDETCPSDTIFISAGYTSKAPISQDKNAPINRIKAQLRQLRPGWQTNSPGDPTSACSLNGGSNIFGKILNGVSEGTECTTDASNAGATGLFVHAEQDWAQRQPDQYDTWAQAIKAAFPVRK